MSRCRLVLAISATAISQICHPRPRHRLNSNNTYRPRLAQGLVQSAADTLKERYHPQHPQTLTALDQIDRAPFSVVSSSLFHLPSGPRPATTRDSTRHFRLRCFLSLLPVTTTLRVTNTRPTSGLILAITMALQVVHWMKRWRGSGGRKSCWLGVTSLRKEMIDVMCLVFSRSAFQLAWAS